MLEAPLLNTPADLTCTITLSSRYSAAENTTAVITLPDGVSIISGNLTWEGDLEPGEPVSFSVRIIFNKVGHHTIYASASLMIDGVSFGGGFDAIYLDIGVDHSQFGWAPEPVKVTIAPDKYSVINTDLEISHAPKLNEPATLFITILSPVNFPGLTAEIIFHHGVELLEGVKKQPIDLKAGIPIHFTATVVFTETGYHTVTADVCEIVDGITYHSPQDTIYLKIGVNESTFERKPTKETHPEDLPPPPATSTISK